MDYFIERIGGSWWSRQSARSFGSFGSSLAWLFQSGKGYGLLKQKVHHPTGIKVSATSTHLFGLASEKKPDHMLLLAAGPPVMSAVFQPLQWLAVLETCVCFGMVKCGELGLAVSKQQRLNKATYPTSAFGWWSPKKSKQDGSHEPECIHVLGLRVKTSATPSEDFLHASHCTLHTPRFTLHTCS